MNPQPDQDLERRLQKLEAELNSPNPSPLTYPETTQPRSHRDNSLTVQSALNQFINWFSGLSRFGKLIVIGVTTLVGFAILRAVLKLVASLISLALLGLLLYFIYQFFWNRNSKNSEYKD